MLCNSQANFCKLVCMQLTQYFVQKQSQEVFCKKVFLKISRPATLLKKRLRHRCFPVNFVKFLRTHFFTEHLRWLLQDNQYAVCYLQALSGHLVLVICCSWEYRKQGKRAEFLIVTCSFSLGASFNCLVEFFKFYFL